jgi:DNA mismatch repair ATPase MutS
MGLNTVLAQAGAPVCARAFAIGRVTLATSMRVRDSLDDGVSHFYAELQKLKRVVDFAKGTPPLLFLLDEILHGTNSRERIIGARSVIQGLVSKGALGAVSTHDLGIAELAEALPGAVRNVHFEEQVKDDGTMTFDYQLREGTVQSSNALRLMRAIGLEVPLEAEGPAPLPAITTP